MVALPTGLELKEVQGPLPEKDASAVSDLRYLTWRHRTDKVIRPKESWIEPLDESARHFLVYNNLNLVTAARLHIFDDWKKIGDAEWFDQLTVDPKPPVAYLSRLVVSPKYQHQGIGKYLDSLRIERARELGARSVFGDVPPYRVKHMEGLGFHVVQAPKKGITLPEIEWTAVYMEF